MLSNQDHFLRARRMGVLTYKEAVVFIHRDSNVCQNNRFMEHARIKVFKGDGKYIIATLNIVTSECLGLEEIGFSEVAWQLLAVQEGDGIFVTHAEPLASASYINDKILGKKLGKNEYAAILHDIVKSRLSIIELTAFLISETVNKNDLEQLYHLTEAMVNVGKKLEWQQTMIVDKHSIGGVPGNRTSMIVVPIIAAFGLPIPKTSSRAITSAAGTADTMEVLAPVTLTAVEIQKVVNKENGCIVWGGCSDLSPADDLFIRVESALSLDSPAQMVSSILSKKLAVGATDLLLDIPIGLTTKVINNDKALYLKGIIENLAARFGLKIKTVFTDGSRPVGRGVGPALEAEEVLKVLQNQNDASYDLREHALYLAGEILEFSSKVALGEGKVLAREILQSGKAWQKFQAICEAQGGMIAPEEALYKKDYCALQNGKVLAIDAHKISKIAHLAGAPTVKVAGIYLNVQPGDTVHKGDSLFTVHAGSKGELDSVFECLAEKNNGVISIAS